MEDNSDLPNDSKNEFVQAGEEKQLSAAGELWRFIKENKAWWMIPILSVLGLVGVLLVLGATCASTFIYTLF